MPEYKLQRFRGGWAIALYDGGRRVSRRQLGARDAAQAAEEFRQVVAEATRPVSPDVRTIWDLYVKDMEGRAVVATMKFTGKAVLPHFGDMKAETITVEDCRRYTASRRKAKRQDGTIWTELGHLRMVLLWAKKRRMIHEAPHIERPAKPRPQESHLTRAEFDKLLDAAKPQPHVVVFLHLARATAGRSAAILDLTWDRVDFQRALVFLGLRNAIRPMKGRATVPMGETLRAALTAAKEGALTDHVVEYGGKPVKKIRRGLSGAAARAKLGHVSPHMIRHSAAVWMVEDGVPLAEVAQYLGHKDVKITASTYAVFSPEYLRRASQSLDW